MEQFSIKKSVKKMYYAETDYRLWILSGFTDYFFGKFKSILRFPTYQAMDNRVVAFFVE